MKLQQFTTIVFDHDGTLVDTSGLTPKLYPGVQDLLSETKSLGFKLFLWTARSRRSVVEILEYLDIIGHFELLSCAGESAAKPSPAGIADILMETDPSEVIVIGDSLGDMIGGKKFGAFCIGAMWSHGNERAEKIMQDNGANKCFLDPALCLEFLKELKEVRNV